MCGEQRGPEKARKRSTISRLTKKAHAAMKKSKKLSPVYLIREGDHRSATRPTHRAARFQPVRSGSGQGSKPKAQIPRKRCSRSEARSFPRLVIGKWALNLARESRPSSPRSPRPPRTVVWGADTARQSPATARLLSESAQGLPDSVRDHSQQLRRSKQAGSPHESLVASTGISAESSLRLLGIPV